MYEHYVLELLLIVGFAAVVIVNIIMDKKENRMGKTKSKVKKKKRRLHEKAVANGTAKKKK